MTKVSIVILNWNGKHFLEKFLPTLCAKTTEANVEFVIADNNSSDDSISFVKKEFPQIRIIEFPKNYGFAEGYYKALKQISAEYYVLLNSDVEVTDNWLTPLISFLDENSQVAACMPKIHAYNNPSSFEYAGAAGGLIDKWGYPFCRGRILADIEQDNGQYNDIKEVFWATGACIVVRSSAYHQVGGLCSYFFAHMEEIDLCWRLINAGHKIYCNPQSAVLHVGGGTLSNENPFKLYLNFRNNLYLLAGNLHKSEFFSTLFIRMCLDGVAFIKYILAGKIAFAFSIPKAHWTFFYKLPRLIRDRKNRTFKKKVEIPGIFCKSIIYQYFIRKKKFFSEL